MRRPAKQDDDANNAKDTHIRQDQDVKKETTQVASSLFTSSNSAKSTLIFGLGVWVAMIFLVSLLSRELPMWSKLKRWRKRYCPDGGLQEINMGEELYGRVCCSDNDNGEFFIRACEQAYDPIVKFFSGMIAWVVALVSPALHHFLDDNDKQRTSLQRIEFYVILFAFRTLVLFLGLGIVEECIKETTDFDFSDHIVLFGVHYIIPALIEVGVLLDRYHRHSYGNIVLCFWNIGILLMMFYYTRPTILYFHAVAENLAALFIVLVSVGLPIILL